MDTLIDLLVPFVRNWRLGLSIVGSLFAATALASVLPWFTGGYVLALVIGCGVAGLFWEGAAYGRRETRIGPKKKARRKG